MINPYQFEVTCDFCGGPGVGTIQTAGASWNADVKIWHINLNDCRRYLKQEAQELKEKENKL